MGMTLHAMAGLLVVSSIRLVGKINGKEVRFLVNSETIQNFIDPLIAKRIGLELEEIHNFKIAVADGEQIEGRQCSPCTRVNI